MSFLSFHLIYIISHKIIVHIHSTSLNTVVFHFMHELSLFRQSVLVGTEWWVNGSVWLELVGTEGWVSGSPCISPPLGSHACALLRHTSFQGHFGVWHTSFQQCTSFRDTWESPGSTDIKCWEALRNFQVKRLFRFTLIPKSKISIINLSPNRLPDNMIKL